MNEPRITVDGMPLVRVLAFERSKEIAQHLSAEVRAIAKECGIRRPSNTPHPRLGRPGRPMRGISLPLLNDLEFYLRDEDCRIDDIADLFGVTANDVRFYQYRLQIQRKRGRKRQNSERRAA